MGTEQKPARPAPPNPQEIFKGMEEGRKLGDVPAFFQGLLTLDTILIPSPENPQQQIRITEAPKLRDYLRSAGQQEIIRQALLRNLQEADRQEDKTAVAQGIRLAELLGFNELKDKYGSKEVRPTIDIQAKSVASEGHPERNEDALFQLLEKRAVGVFDGIGGHAAGDKASRLARDYIGTRLKLGIQGLQEGVNPQQAQDAIRQTLIEANQSVYKQAQVEKNKMGTTASVVYIWEGLGGERKAIVGNVGDSRVYLLRDGRLEQITLDDNFVRGAMPSEQQARQLQSKLNNVIDPQEQLTNEERQLFNQRNIITQSLGQQKVEPRIQTISLLPKDRLLVCSDGISDNLTNSEIQDILNANQNNKEAVQKLIEASLARSRSSHPRAKADDMTAIMIGEVEPSLVLPKEAIPKKDVEPPEIPYYNQPWEEVFGPGQEIGEGLAGHVYRPEQHSDVVIKVFDKRPEYFQQELGILKKLQGLPHVVKLLGHGGPPYFSPRQQYLVKEFIEGENLAEYFIWDPSTFPLKAGETPSVKYEDHKKLAAWLVSSMEALGQIHKKGILVSDFKFADYLWDPQKGKTVLIDFANAVDMNDPMQEYRGKSPEHDIDALLAIFFYKTLFGQQFGMTIEQNGATWPPRNPGESFLETTRLFKAKAQELRATSSLIKIIELLEDPVKWDPSPKRHPAQEYAQALKDHFKEVGIDISQIPTENRGAAAETPLTPERQTLEQTATQQAQALAQQTGSPITEADLERYGQWKKSKEGQG